MAGSNLPLETLRFAAVGSSVNGLDRDRLREIAELASRGDAEATGKLTEALADPRWHIRRAAAEALAGSRSNELALRAVLAAMRSKHRDLGLLNGVLSVLKRTDLDVVRALSEFLGDPDSDLRIYAALALGERSEPEAVPALLSALDDPDSNVRCQAIEALGKIGSAAATERLVALALASNFAEAFAALDALAIIGDRRIASRLLPLLSDDLLGEAAVMAVGQLGDEEAIAPLVTLLDSDRVSATALARALGAIHEHYQQRYREGANIAGLVRQLIKPAALQKVLNAIERCQPSEAPLLARMLGWFAGEAVIAGLIRLLTIPEARREAGEALVRQGAAAAQALAGLLHGPDTTLLRVAIELLGRIGAREHVRALIELLDEEDGVATLAMGALAMIGDASAYPAVSPFLGHPRATVRQAAVGALNSIAHPNRAKDLQRWLRDPSPLVRESALKIACYLGFPECVELILAGCSDDNEQVRKAAVENIALLEDERVPALIAEALRTGTAPVRAVAARTLAGVTFFQSHLLLIDALEDPDVWVRYYAAKSLGAERRGTDETLVALSRIAQHDSAMQVRIAAVEVLGERGQAEVVPLLVSLLDAPEAELAQPVLGALGATRHAGAVPVILRDLEVDQPEVRKSAVRALGSCGQIAAVTPLVRMVQADDREVGAAALEALGRLDFVEAIDALLEFTRLPRWREICLRILIRAPATRVTWIVRGVEHADLDIRRAVIEVLTQVRSQVATDALRRAALDREPAVRHAAMTALAHGPRPG